MQKKKLGDTMIGQRTTRQRTAITALLGDLVDFRSAQQVHALLSQRGERIGLATVYRTLNALVTAGEVDALRTESGESVYRRCNRPHHHHHHLVCRICGSTVEVQGVGLEEIVKGISEEHKFTDVEHTLELFGTCPRCR